MIHNIHMEAHAEHVLQSALGLPASQRAEIAGSLIASLDEQSDSDADAAWAAEIKRRLDSIDRGEVQLIPWDDAICSMRERLNESTADRHSS